MTVSPVRKLQLERHAQPERLARLVSWGTKEKKERSETTAKTEKTVKMETKARTAMKEAAEMMAPMAEAVPTVRAVPTDPVEKRVRTEA